MTKGDDGYPGWVGNEWDRIAFDLIEKLKTEPNFTKQFDSCDGLREYVLTRYLELLKEECPDFDRMMPETSLIINAAKMATHYYLAELEETE